MIGRRMLRAIALALCLSMLALSCLAEAAEVFTAPVDGLIQEEAEFSLAPDDYVAEAAPQYAAEVASGGLAAPEQPEAAPAQPVTAPEQPVTAPEQPEAVPAQAPTALKARVFSETLSVENDVWQGVNLVRAEGFTGLLAQVNGQLTLSGVTIDGIPARDVDLSLYFAIGPTGRISIQDDSALAINLSVVSLNKGSRVTLALASGGMPVEAKQAQWSSSNRKIAKVSRGVVKARKAGVAVITVSWNGAVNRCAVVVTDYKQVKSVKFGHSRLTLALNGAVQLAPTIKPSNAFDKTLTWASSAPEIVSVDQNGWIAGLSGGKATITATSVNGKTGKCVITVDEIKPKALSLARPYITLHPGEQFAAQPVFSPQTVSNPAVLFASSDPAVATVDAGGLITAVGYGTATITVASVANPAALGTCRVSVREPGSARMAGLIIGINPGHQKTTIKKKYPLAPGSGKKAYGVKTGACGKWTRVNEYETVLQIGLKLAQLLTDEGATVVITRTSNDVMLTNIDRAQMLNNAGVDVALQLHCNSTSNSRAEGCSGYIRTTGNWPNESRAIAASLTSAISASTGCVDLGVKVYNDYMSLNWTTTPSVLLELGYLSNRKEDRLLATDDYRQRIAEGIVEGLCAYYGR